MSNTHKKLFYRVHTIAAGKRTQTIESAKAEAEKVRLIGAAEAKSIEAVGRAEAESMRMKAKAYQQYGDEAVMALVLESLPSIAKQVAKPLEKVRQFIVPIDKILHIKNARAWVSMVSYLEK